MCSPTSPDHSGGRPDVPTPPGGAPLQIDPSRIPAVQSPPHPVVDETSAGGLALRPWPSTSRRPGPEHTAFDVAVLLRRNRSGRLEWCLPKGHLEGKETPQEAAVREVWEETGIHGSVQMSLGVIDYWFTGEDRRVHKVVHHFLMRAESGSLTVENDPDNEAEDAVWVSLADLPHALSYPNEQRLAVTAATRLASSPQVLAALRNDASSTESFHHL